MDDEWTQDVKWWRRQGFREKLLLIAFAALCLLAVLRFTNVWNGITFLVRAAKPLIYGSIVAYILDLPTDFFERKLFRTWTSPRGLKVRRALSFLLSLFMVLGVFAVIMVLLIPQAIESIRVFIQVFPSFYDRAVVWLEQLARNNPDVQEQIRNLVPDVSVLIDQISGNLSSWASNVFSVLSGVVGGTVNAVFAFVFAIYIVLSKHTLQNQLDRVLNWTMRKQRKQKMHSVLRVADRTFSDFIAGQVLEAFILGSLCTVGMLIFRFPYATMIGSFVGLTALIPLIGAFLGGALGAILIATQDPVKALFFVIFLIILQQLEGDLIYPKVVGDKIGLPGMWVLAGVTLGGAIYGIPGTLIGVPLLATVYKLLRNKTMEEEGRLHSQFAASEHDLERIDERAQEVQELEKRRTAADVQEKMRDKETADSDTSDADEKNHRA